MNLVGLTPGSVGIGWQPQVLPERGGRERWKRVGGKDLPPPCSHLSLTSDSSKDLGGGGGSGIIRWPGHSAQGLLLMAPQSRWKVFSRISFDWWVVPRGCGSRVCLPPEPSHPWPCPWPSSVRTGDSLSPGHVKRGHVVLA